MAIDLFKARDECKRQGLAFPCSLCNYYWDSVDRRRAEGKAGCDQTECGGPRSGETFPLYKGALPAGEWGHFCFVCGSDERLTALRVSSRTRTLAVCGAHGSLVEGWLKDVARPLPKQILFVGSTRV